MKNAPTLLAVLFITILFLAMSLNKPDIVNDDQSNARGEAISAYLLEHHGQIVAPEQAQYLNIQLNQFNLSVKDLDIFTTKIIGEK